MLGIGIVLIFVVVMLFSLLKSAGMADRKFEELQSMDAIREKKGNEE